MINGCIAMILHGVLPKKSVIFVATSLITSDIDEPIFRAEIVIFVYEKNYVSRLILCACGHFHLIDHVGGPVPFKHMVCCLILTMNRGTFG